MKNHTETLAEKLMLNEMLGKLQTYLTVKFIINLSLVAEKYIIFVVCDKLSYFVITIKEMLVKELTRLFRNNMWKLHGLSKSIIPDRELQLTAKLTKELNKMVGIETKLQSC